MEKLHFSKNWNNKLDCMAFTTLRLPNQKYQINHLFEITLDGICKGIGKLISINYISIDDIDEFIARLDTGCSIDECKNIIIDIYPNIDFNQQQLALLLISKVDQE